MEQFSIVGLVLSCLATPLALLLLVGLAYALGRGGVKLPGVTRGEAPSDKDWSTVPETVKNTSTTVAAIIGLAGGLFGILGFLLPWAKLNVSASELLPEFVGGLEGTMTGIALAVQSLVGATLLIASGEEGAIGVGILLLLLSLFIWLVAIAIVATTASSLSTISVPLGLSKRNVYHIARVLMGVGAISMCLSLTYLASMQATIGGIQVGVKGIGISMEVGSGFWITLGGLLLALIGAWAANILTERLSDWAAKLTRL